MRLAVFVFSMMLILSGCSTLGLNSTDSSETGPSASQYYDFDDVQIPAELEFVPEKSFILETPTMKSGVLAFKGKVTRLSLTEYFITNLSRDNWSMRSAFKSQRSLLLFEKANKYCIVSIVDNRFGTDCEIWVLPKQGGMSQQMIPETAASSPAPIGTTTPYDSPSSDIPVEELPFPINDARLPN